MAWQAQNRGPAAAARGAAHAAVDRTAHTNTIPRNNIKQGNVIALLTGQGTVEGTFAVVVQDDNVIDGPEYVVMNGTFSGAMDLSIRPLGKVSGTFVPAITGQAIPFCGTFRLPFGLNLWGKRENPRRGQSAYYMANDGKSVFPAVHGEKALGMPTVRLELTFGSLCR